MDSRAQRSTRVPSSDLTNPQSCFGSDVKVTLWRLIEQPLAEWLEAYYDPLGKGSTVKRARAIRDIYDKAAPIPDAVMLPPSKKFLAEVRRIVTVVIQNNGGYTADGAVAFERGEVIKTVRSSDRSHNRVSALANVNPHSHIILVLPIG